MPPFDLETTYLALDRQGGVAALPVGPEFWDTIDRNPALTAGTLVGVYPLTGDWPHWEMHPAGDEVLVLLEGAATMIVRHRDGQEARHALQAGSTLVVPAGAWHRALVTAPGRLLALTYGAGTEHRPA